MDVSVHILPSRQPSERDSGSVLSQQTCASFEAAGHAPADAGLLCRPGEDLAAEPS